MAMRYPGGFISSTAPTVSANSAKGIWTLEEVMQYIRAGQWPVPTGNGDPYFQYNTMLLPGQGTNGAQNHSFLDSSSNNFTVNRSGNTTQGTFTPFSGANGYWGMYNSGSSYLSIADNAAFNLSGTPFTIEAWVYHVADSGAYTNWVVGKRGTGSPFTSVWALSISSTNFVEFGTTGYTWGITSSFPIQRNTWNHIAGTYDGTSVRLYVNGVLAAGPTAATVSDVGAAVTIGNYTVGANPVFTGYISNLRIVKGVAVYTGNFTPPTAPLASTQSAGTNIAAITGTQTGLLTCQSNRFVDNSTNAFAITVNSTPQVTPFQPFGAPTVAYSASTIGGSGYFDGSGDYVSVGNDALLAPGTGDFTWEGWFYWIGGSGENVVWTLDTTGGMNIGLAISSGQWGIGSRGVAVQNAFGTLTKNQWMYLAITRSGTTINAYYNGTRIFTGSNSYNYVSGGTLALGSIPTFAGQDFNGYMSGVRWTKGTALYTGSTMTIPTTPNTTTSGGASATTTELLLDFTNAGIIDNAQDNNLETVGGAQISTTQYKWGASSMYFDGTGDYLDARLNPPQILNADFTVEMWVYPTTITGSNRTFLFLENGSNSASFFMYGATGYLAIDINNVATYNLGSTAITTGSWQHIAFIRIGTSVKAYINGNQVGTATVSAALGSSGVMRIGAGASAGAPYFGYIADMRVTKGYARYPYNFTAPTAALPLFWQAAATPSADPYFDYTTLLLPGNGTNGAQNNTFLDSSTNNFSITRNGNTTQGTFTPFSQTGWSLRTNDRSYLSMTANSDLDLINTDFTVEFWWKFNDFNTMSSSGNNLFGNGASNASNGWFTSFGGSGDTVTTLSYFVWSGGSITGNDFTVSIDKSQWNHIAFVRSGTGSGNLKLYINGVQVGAAQSAVTYSSAGGTFTLGSGSYTQNGTYSGNADYYISNVRLTKSAVYTSNFTVPTSALTALAATTLLICQSNRLVNNGSYNATVSSGSFTSTLASVQAFSPFNPTAAYSTSTVGGSGYFDGSGDYLSVAANTALDVGSGDFSIDVFAYPLAKTNLNDAVFGYGSLTMMLFHNNTNWTFEMSNNGSSNQVAINFSVTLNAWQYIAVRKSGTSVTVYKDGVSVGTGTISGSVNTSGKTLEIGRNGSFSTQSFTGYIGDFRLVKGTSLASFAVPTAPLTAVSGTSILTNFTNGGIIDNTAKNNLETAGGASISTAVSKFGGSSMYFDGTGDYLVVRYNRWFGLLDNQGDFTLEGWFYRTVVGATQFLLSTMEFTGTYTGWGLLFNNTNTAGFFCYDSGNNPQSITSTATVGLNTWTHVAVSRYGGVTRLFVNGVNEATRTTAFANTVTQSPLVFGLRPDFGDSLYTGYMQDVRITFGIARYTTNFTPPTTAFLTL